MAARRVAAAATATTATTAAAAADAALRRRRMTAATTAKMMPPGRQVPSPLPDACEAVHCCKQKKHTLESKNGFCQLAWREWREGQRTRARERARTRERECEREGAHLHLHLYAIICCANECARMAYSPGVQEMQGR